MKNIVNIFVLKIYLMVTIVGAFLFFVSCSDNDDVENGNETICGESVFFYIPYNIDIDTCINSDIEEVKDIVATYGRTLLSNRRILIYKFKHVKRAYLFELKYEDGKCICDTLGNYEFNDNATNYATTSGLTSVLNELKSKAPAQTYSMIVECHGMGWVPADTIFKLKARKKAFGSFINNNSDYLTDITTLADALEAADMDLNLLAFDDCYMAQAEIAYELRNRVRYLVGSVCEVAADGIPYSSSFISLINRDFQTYLDAYKAYYSGKGNKVNAMNSVIDCSKIEVMANVMKEINSQYSYDSSDGNSELMAYDGYSEHIFFDMADYVNAFVPDGALKANFNAALSDLVPYNTYGETCYSKGNGAIWAVDSCCGITLSDPTLNASLLTVKEQTAWWAATH